MEIKKVTNFLERIAPLELAEPFDNGKIGLILDMQNDIKNISVAVDPTKFVLEEAAEDKADMLIVHHPPIFNSINKIPNDLAQILKIALDNNISIYAMHTNYDKADGGINDALADFLKLKNLQNLPMGRIGETSTFTYPDEYAKFVANAFDAPVQMIGDLDAAVHRVMVIGGSGFSYASIELAKANNVDAFISSEIPHHLIRYAEDLDDLVLISATHYATEFPGMLGLVHSLRVLDVEPCFIPHIPKVKYFTDK